MSDMILSPKYKAFMRYNKASVEFLEGTTAAGKTTVGVVKFLLRVAQSPKRLHIMAAQDTGVFEKNIINADLGILDVFGDNIHYRGNGSKELKIPHLILHTEELGDKIILVLGYGDSSKWKKTLGGQYGCLYIDEINTADIEFVRESSMRCDYLMGTLNPDDPELPIYSEFINHSRPLDKYKNDAPPEINEMLEAASSKQGWVHWFFSFKDNLGLTKEKIQKIIDTVPVGTKLYKNKIQGLRGKATGLIFPNFNRTKHLLSTRKVKEMLDNGSFKFVAFTAGLDTSYSQNSPDTFAFTFQGITSNRMLIYLDEEVYNNGSLEDPLAPSDISPKFISFLEKNRKNWGFSRDTYIDCADQATITELLKYKRLKGTPYNFINSYKKVEILDRIHLQLGWIAQGYYYVLDHCTNHIKELESYSWKQNKYEPEDGNDHTINSAQYGWIPYRDKIGIPEKREGR